MGSKVIRRIIALRRERLGTWLHCHIFINYLMLQQQKNLIQCVIDSYLDKGIDPLSRIEKIWYATFFLRYWCQWILQHSNYTVQNNFITQNAYLCIELNGHVIVLFADSYMRDYPKKDGVYLPWLLGSQSCEKTFRLARSMTSTFSTIINFSICLDYLGAYIVFKFNKLNRKHLE